MIRRQQIIPSILLSFILVSLLTIPQKEAVGSSYKKIDKPFATKLQTNPQKRYSAILILEQVQLSTINSVGKQPRKKQFAELQQASSETQRDLKKFLAGRKSAGSISDYKPFWILNGILVEGTGSEILTLSNRSDIESVIENKSVPVPQRPKTNKNRRVEPNAAGIEWNISKIGADKVWTELGFDGTGVKIGILDSGVDGTHPDIIGKISKAGRINSNGSITDITTKSSDGLGHGTHVAGIAVGGDAGGSKIGVAPGSSLVVGQLGITDWSVAKIISGMQWIIDPDKDPNTDDGANIVNMSFGDASIPHYFDPIQRMLDLNVVPVASSGNSGLGTIFTPASVPGTLATGATNDNDSIAYWSSGAVAKWAEPQMSGKWIKPDVSAPGVSINSALSGVFEILEGGKWAPMDGTSMAAPHVSGVAALIKQANPGLSAEQIKRCIELSSIDRGAKGKDVRYGTGRIDARKAVEWALTLGRLNGSVKSPTGQPLKADINIPALETLIESDSGGSFDSYLPQGNYDLEVSAYGYVPQTVNVNVVQNNSATENIILQLSPSYSLSGVVKKQGTNAVIPGAVVKAVGINGAQTQTSASGAFLLKLPLGVYTIQVSHPSFVKRSVVVNILGNAVENIDLKAKPSILIVDDNENYNALAGNYVNFYTDALDALGKQYTVWRVWDESSAAIPSVPRATDLKNYQTVIWTSDSYPSYMSDYDWDDINDELVIRPNPLINYLNNKGNIFLSGQDLAYYSDEDLDDFLGSYLDTEFVDEPSNTFTVNGTAGIYNGMQFRIYNAGADDGANNQSHPDVIDTVEGFSKPRLAYVADKRGFAATSIETYKYKGLFLGFGFEGIGTQATRTEVMRRAIEWLNKDTLAPQITFLQNLTGGKHVKGISSSNTRILDNKGIAQVKLFIDNKFVRNLAKPYSVTIDTRKFKSGKHTIKLVAKDTAGNVASKSTTAFFDNKKPEISFSNIIAGQKVSGKASVNLKASDNLVVNKVVLYVNSKKFSAKKVSGTDYAVNWDTSDIPDGKYEFKALILDKAGNKKAVKSYAFVANGLFISNMAAKPAGFSPNNDGAADTSAIGFSVNKTAKVNVAVSNYKGVVKSLFNGYLAKGSYSYAWDGTDSRLNILPNGGYLVKITASNGAEAAVAQTIVKVENPTVSIMNVSASPNPFSPNNDGINDVANIGYKLSIPARVTVQISNYKGVFRTLISNIRQAGQNTVSWNGRNSSGNLLSNGVYLCTITARDDNNAVDTEKILVEIVR